MGMRGVSRWLQVLCDDDLVQTGAEASATQPIWSLDPWPVIESAFPAKVRSAACSKASAQPHTVTMCPPACIYIPTP